MSEFVTYATAAAIWLFDTIIAIGTIQHRTIVLVDVLLIVFGMLMARPAHAGGRRMYSEFGKLRARIEKR